MRTGPKSLTGLGSPASLRGPLAALSKGGGVPAGFELVTALNAQGVRETVTALNAQGVREPVWARKAA